MNAFLRRAVTSHLVVVIALLVVGVGLAGAALVGFSAETQHQASTFSGGWIAAPPTVQTPVPAGYGATLTWTLSTHGSTGQALFGTDMSTTNNCTGATYATSFNGGLAVNATTTTDSRGASANGHWLCYQIRATHGSWFKGTNFGAVQVGLVPAGIASSNNGGTSGQIENGDKITLTFNQSVSYSGPSPIAVCVWKTPANSIVFGDTGCAASTDTGTVGALTGLNIPGGNKTYPTSTVAASGSTVVITLGGANGGPAGRTQVTGGGTFTYNAAANTILSTSGSASVCTAANCTWSYTAGF
jgi:hypothetical protein